MRAYDSALLGSLGEYKHTSSFDFERSLGTDDAVDLTAKGNRGSTMASVEKSDLVEERNKLAKGTNFHGDS